MLSLSIELNILASGMQSSVTQLQQVIFSTDILLPLDLTELVKKLPPIQRPYFEFFSQTKSPESSFVHNPVTPEEVKLETASIPNNKYHGLYSCPSQLLECSSNITSGVLAKNINSCILNGVYPSELKMAKVVAVYKADD